MDDLRRSFGEVKVCGVGLLSLHARYPELLQRVFSDGQGNHRQRETDIPDASTVHTHLYEESRDPMC